MVGMGGQPLVDEALDDAAAAERAADVGPAALGVEVLLELGVVRVALAAAGDLGLDLRVGDGHALGVGDLRQDEQGPDPLLGARPELGVEVGIGLVEGLEVGLLGDALAGERARGTRRASPRPPGRPGSSGSSSVALATAYSMIRSAKPWRARSRALRSSRALTSARSASTSAKSPSVPTKSSSSSGRTFSRSSRSSTAKWAGLAGQLRLRVVVREGDVELGRAADLEPDEVGLEARDEPLLAEDQRHPLGRPALERLAVARSDERDDRVVAVLRAATLDRGRASRSGRAAPR